MSVSRNDQWWLNRLQLLFDQLGVNAGLRYSHRGTRVRRLDVQPGQISARLQDREFGDGTLTILIDLLSETQWKAIVDQMRDQALYAAHLLSEQLPVEIEPIFFHAGATLMPQSLDEVTVESSFPPAAQVQVLAALYSALVDLLQSDPWLLLLLRGRSRDQLLGELRQVRNEGVVAVAHPADVMRQADASFFYHVTEEPTSPEEGIPLAAQLDQFWGDSRQLRLLHHYISPPAVQLALVRRLGPISQAPEWQPLEEKLSAIYRSVTDAALAIAYDVQSERENGKGE
ncbi:MAG: hypothetical protein U0175_11255 [Caldilineaceae bacterium]